MNREELLKAGKPILFNTEMVKAILEGRKSCTRRVIKLDLGLADTDENDNSYLYVPNEYGDYHNAKDLCRYKVGDILYVRETWCYGSDTAEILFEPEPRAYDILYKADYKYLDKDIVKWKPSIHMPKKLARIFLKVTDVRVERLQDIDKLWSNYDKEGMRNPETENISIAMQEKFIDVWNSTIRKQDLDKYEWEANPWVWVIEFLKMDD